MDFNEIFYSYKIFWHDALFFSGRTRRTDFFIPVIINSAITFVLSFLGPVGGTFNMAFAAVAFLPSLANDVRRLHDTGKSAWYLLALAVPVVGWILLVIWLCSDSKGDNQYGVSLKYPGTK